MIPARTKEITADWLNGALHSSGVLQNETITAIGHESWGVGEGFVSDMARITPTYDRDAPNLPKTMIAKLPTSFESARAIGMFYKIYEREIRFYSEVAPSSPIRTPGLLCGEVDSENQLYALIMEDCSHYAQLDQLEGLGEEEARLVALKLADFHARWWESDDLLSFPWMAKPGGPEAMSLTGTYRGCWDACASMKGFAEAMPPGGWEAGLRIYQHYPWLIESVAENHLTISHFDFRVDNMFFDWDTPDDPLIVFDWGGASVSRPEPAGIKEQKGT